VCLIFCLVGEKVGERKMVYNWSVGFSFYFHDFCSSFLCVVEHKATIWVG
jgi:hypothetical protein